MVLPNDVCSVRYMCYNQMLPVDATGILCSSCDSDMIYQWVTELRLVSHVTSLVILISVYYRVPLCDILLTHIHVFVASE